MQVERFYFVRIKSGLFAGAGQNHCKGLEHDQNVILEAEGAGIGVVIHHTVDEFRASACFDLPQTGETGLELVIGRAASLAIKCVLIGGKGAGTDDAHIAVENVIDLRQLVDACFAHEFTETDDARIVLELLVLVPLSRDLGIFGAEALETLFCIHMHGAELVAFEELTVFADPQLGIEARPAVHAHEKVSYADNKTYWNNCTKHDCEVENALAYHCVRLVLCSVSIVRGYKIYSKIICCAEVFHTSPSTIAATEARGLLQMSN